MKTDPYLKCTIKPICGSFVGIGGLQGKELLVRFLCLKELEILLDGRLSLKQAYKFVEEGKDKCEGLDTIGDRIWRKNFFGELNDYISEKQSIKRESILRSCYVSCWHRYSKDSKLKELGQRYLTDSGGVAILTSVHNVFESFFPPDGTANWLDLRGVIYIDNENKRLEDYLVGQPYSCVYPQLLFKKKEYSEEQEARFVLHDASANNIDCNPCLNNPEMKYVDIKAESFISRIFYFDKKMEKKILKIKNPWLHNIALNTTLKNLSEEISHTCINKISRS